MTSPVWCKAAFENRHAAVAQAEAIIETRAVIHALD